MSEPRTPPADVLRWPLIGPLLRWRHFRTSLQIVGLLIALVVIGHGFFGPDFAPTNLATVITWVHYRGLLVVALLAAGNVFCTGCPFVLVRDAGRRVRRPTRRWPRALRRKWIGILLFVAVLFTYELFDLWALPRGTAILVLAYFGAAFLVDLMFTGATFCKYLCPIGQFNFVASTVSPLEVRIRRPETCRTCRTFDCIKGRADTKQRGCELGLFQPLKVGNLDCTFCLDCVQACPYDNVALGARIPGAEILDSRRRSGIGRLTSRPDIAAVAILFVFGGLLNAFAMTTAGFDVERALAHVLGGRSEAPILGALFIIALGALPLVLLGGAALVTHRLTRRVPGSIGDIAVRYAFTLIPFGFALWIAHYSFHLLTGALTIVPLTQSAVIDAIGRAALGGPFWHWTGMQHGSVFPIQLGFILLGTIGSLMLAYLNSERDYPDGPVSATAPWAAVVIVLAITAVWVLSQPMEMRGLSVPG